MKRDFVQSSSIISVGFDAPSSTMEIEFKDGRIYQYFEIPEQVFRDLKSAPSVGSYFHQNVRGKYAYAQL